MAEELAKTRLGMKLQKLANCHKALKLTITVDRESLSAATERFTSGGRVPRVLFFDRRQRTRKGSEVLGGSWTQ